MSSMVTARLAPGTLLGGDFLIERRLGSGAMGTVYVAEQRSTGKLRAVKVMNSRLAGDEKSRERFAQEARVGSKIDSDHVVEVLAAGVEEPAGMPWLAMELLEGDDLGALLRRRGALPRDEVRVLCAQLCHGLGAAHRAGLVHRDLKPENIFVARPRHAGVPFTLKLLDFGIAKIVRAADATGTTAGVGSPLWMAPEQVVDGGRVRTATDVWTLGLLVFYMLTGKHYWRSANDDAPLLDLLLELRKGPTERASERAASYGVSERVPSGFDEWFARCVEVSADARFVDATAALGALDPLLAAEPGLLEAVLSSPPAAPTAQARSPVRLLFVIAGMIVLAALASAWLIHRSG